MISRLFVYGTLRPSESRWPAIEGFVARAEPAVLEGFRMYALPEGYPAIAPGPGDVCGTLLHLEPSLVAGALAKADQIEGYVEGSPRSLYKRVVVNLDGSDVYTYVYHPNRRDHLHTNGQLIESGDWLGRDQ